MGRRRSFTRGALGLLTLLAIVSVGSGRAHADGGAVTVDGGAVAADGGAVAVGMPPVPPLEFRGDVRELPLIYAPPPPYRPRPGTPPEPGTLSGSEPERAPVSVPASRAPMPSPVHDFAGLDFSDLCGGVQCGGGWPAISNGAAGRKHYVQAVNFAYAIYSKTGTLLASFTENQLFSAA